MHYYWRLFPRLAYGTKSAAVEPADPAEPPESSKRGTLSGRLFSQYGRASPSSKSRQGKGANLGSKSEYSIAPAPVDHSDVVELADACADADQ